MKKFIIIIATFAAAFSLSATVAEGQSRQLVKEAKKTARALTKEGWKTDGGIHSIEYYLLRYYALEEENELIEGRASGISDNNTRVAANLATQNAAQEYVRLNTSYFKGAGADLMGKLKSETVDNVVNGTISRFEGGINGKLSVSFVLFRENGGQLNCIAYCYIDKKKAEDLRREAMEGAIDEAELANEFYDTVSRMVNGNE